MMKKIEDFMNRHFVGVLIAVVIFTFVVGISLIEFGLEMYLFYFIVGGCVFGYIWMFYEHHKARKALKKVKQGWRISELKDFYKEQFNVVNQTTAEYNCSIVNDHNWLFTFNNTVRDFLQNIKNRPFSSFDFASCLIYSLVIEPVAKFEDYTQQQLFAFSCAKKLISKPFFYYYNTTVIGEVLLNFEVNENDVLEEVRFDFPNEVFTDKVICEIITAYTSSGESEDFMQLSDVLKKMHSMCRSK